MDVKALHNISYGIYIVSSNKSDTFNAQIANTVFQITNDPVTVAVSISKQNLTHEYVTSSLQFGVSILSEETPLSFISNFGFKSGRDINKFKGIGFKVLSSGCPVVMDNAVSYLETKVINSLDCGTHTIFMGKVSDSEVLKQDRVMTYEYYHKIKHGVTPKTAPTFIKEDISETLKNEVKMEQYKCNVCGYIYDPQKGDPDAGIKPGTPFEEIPDTWVCPVCGADKSQFVSLKNAG